MATDKFGTALRAALKDPAVAARMVELGGDIVPEAKQTPKGLRSWLKPEIRQVGRADPRRRAMR